MLPTWSKSLCAQLHGTPRGRALTQPPPGVSWLEWNAILRGDELPLALAFQPDVGHAVAVFIALRFGGSHLMVSAGDYGDVSVHVHSQVCFLGQVHLGCRVGGVGHVAHFAEDAAILHG